MKQFKLISSGNVIKRASAHKRGYTKAWARFRKAYLTRHPLCSTTDCKQFACHVDHKIALVNGGDKYDESNLQALCSLCHNRKTVLYDGGFGRKRRNYS